MADLDSTSYDNLIAGTQKQPVTRPATIDLNEKFSRGALLGRVTATGYYQEAKVSNYAAYDGMAVATEAIDTTPTGAGAGLTRATTDVFVEGEFTENGVTFFYGDVADDWREDLANRGIYLRKSISVLGQ